jgi:hypothetical protein
MRLAANVIGSDTDIFNRNSVSINDLQLFNTFTRQIQFYYNTCN